MKNSTKWKEHILKSSLPLEFEIKKFLDSKGCISNFEHSYLRDNENNIPKEFSYDIDSAYIRVPHYIDLMIECKYRHKSTNWVFIPEEYGGHSESYPNAFMHPNDHFCKYNFPYSGRFPIKLAPLCSKGIEINTTGSDTKSINQAIAQLSYAFAERIADGMIHQVENLLVTEMIFYHIPIIVTTANLFRLRSNVDIRKIEEANDLREVADEYNCLVIKNHIGIELKQHNQRIFDNILNSYNKKLIAKKLNSFNKDLRFVLSVIATTYCPEMIVVINHTAENTAFSNLFTYVDNLISLPEDLKNLIIKQQKESEDILKQFKKKKLNKNKSGV